MIRLGVAVRILGRAGLRARDGRRAERSPHLSVSLLLVREVLLYLAEQRIGCYRLADDLAPCPVYLWGSIFNCSQDNFQFQLSSLSDALLITFDCSD